eukprot:572214-Pleurochrysis_carterae.AAC.5
MKAAYLRSGDPPSYIVRAPCGAHPTTTYVHTRERSATSIMLAAVVAAAVGFATSPVRQSLLFSV